MWDFILEHLEWWTLSLFTVWGGLGVIWMFSVLRLLSLLSSNIKDSPKVMMYFVNGKQRVTVATGRPRGAPFTRGWERDNSLVMVSLWGCCPSLQGGSHRCDKCAFPSVSILLSNYSHYIISTSPDHHRHRGLTPLLLPFIPYSCVFHRAGLRLFAWGLHRVLNDQSLSIQGSDTSPLLAGFGKLWLITGVERA